MKKSFWFLIFLAVLVVIFSVQNANVVSIEFVVWKGEVSLAILLILTFLVGLITGALYSALNARQKKKAGKENVAGDMAFDTPREESDVEESEKY